MNEISSPSRNGYASIAYLLEKHRSQNTPLFFLFGGGSIGPSMLSAFDRGSHIIDLLNAIEPDAMATTKRDFSFFEDELSLRSYEAAFPFVATNIVDKNTNKPLDGLIPFVIAEQGPFKIGILSTLSKEAIHQYNLNRIDITDKIAAINKYARSLRQQKVDFIVLLNSGIEKDVVSLLNDNIVDLILQKESNPQDNKNRAIPDHPRFVFVENRDEIAVIDVNWTTSQDIQISSQLSKYSNLDKDSDMEKMLNQYEGRLSMLLDEVIGKTTSEFNTYRLSVRKYENAFGNLIVDSVKSYTGADIAILNGGTIRGEKQYVKNQNISRKDIISELPYRNNVVLLNVTGEELHKAIEHGLSGLDNVLGRFLQISGLQIKYNSSNTAGSRLISVLHQGQKLEVDKQYKVAMSNYLAKGGDDYHIWQDTSHLSYARQPNVLISEIVINHIKEAGVISPKVDNRIIDIATNKAGL